MATVNAGQWGSLERGSPTLFLLAGILLVVFATLLGYEAVTGTSAPEDIFGPPGFFLAMVGILGLYPSFADLASRLARLSAFVAAGSAIGWLVITALSIAEVVGVLPAAEAMGPLAFATVPVTGIMMISAYLVASVVSFRTGVHSRTVGVLLLAPPAIFVVMLSQFVLFAQFGLFSEAIMAWSAVALSGGQAVVHLGIGQSLRSNPPSTDRSEPTPDSTTR